MNTHINEFVKWINAIGLNNLESSSSSEYTGSPWARWAWEKKSGNNEYIFGEVPVMPISSLIQEARLRGEVPNFVTLNPLRPGATKKARSEILCYTNILIEIDSFNTLQNQFEYVAVKLGMPFTSCVSSGGKSLHFIISLDTKINYNDYKLYTECLHKIIEDVDKTVKDPVKFTRAPFSHRPETGRSQELIELDSKVNLTQFRNWINKRLINIGSSLKIETERINNMNLSVSPKHTPEFTEMLRNFSLKQKLGLLSRRAEAFFMYGTRGAPHLNWRQEAFYSCCDAYRNGFSEEDVEQLLLSVDGYINDDCKSIPEDAFKVFDKQELD